MNVYNSTTYLLTLLACSRSAAHIHGCLAELWQENVTCGYNVYIPKSEKKEDEGLLI